MVWQRRPQIASLLSLFLSGAWAMVASGGERDAQIEQIRSLARAGKHVEVEVQAQTLLDALPADDRPTAWSIDLYARWAEDVRFGRRHIYLMRTIHGPELLTRWTEPTPDPKHAPSNREGYGWLFAVTCVDGATGRPLWSRRFVPPTRMAIDPRDDALWSWERIEGTSILRIDADTGADTVRGRMPRYSEGVDAIRALRVGGLQLWSAPTANNLVVGRDDELDIETGKIRRETIHPALLSPRGQGALREAVFEAPNEVSTAVELVPAVNDRSAPTWSFRFPGYSSNPPVWFGDDVLILAGTLYSHGTVSRIDGRTGKVRWTHVLTEPAHSPGMNQLVGGTFPPRGWSAVGEVAGKVVVLGSLGTVFFLDALTGERLARFSTGTWLLGLPRVFGGQLVLAGSANVRAVPLGRILGESKLPDDWLTLQELRARSFLARGRPADALAIAEVIARDIKDSPSGWTLVAEAREDLGRGSEAVAARVAAIAADGLHESAALRQSHGLLWRLPTAPVDAAPVVDGSYLVVGCRDGRLLTIDTRGLRVVGVEQAPVDIAALSLDGPRVVRRGVDRREAVVRTLELPARDLHPRDPLLPKDEPPGLPASWYEAMFGDGPSIAVGNRRARGLRGGTVRVFENGIVKNRPPAVPGIEWWRITLIGSEPLGYGTGGVYRLDRDFRPVERIIDAGQKRDQSNMAFLLDGDDDSLCVLAGPYNALRLQLWSRDAKTLLREAAVRSVSRLYDEPYRLRRLRNGYLLSAGELIWLPKAASGQVWRFSTYLDPSTGPSEPRFDKDHAVFGIPRVVGDRLFVADRCGGLYAFAVPAIVGGNGKLR